MHPLTCSIKYEINICQSIGKIPDSCRKSVILGETICFADPKLTPIIKARFRLSPNITFISISVLLPICANLHLHFWAHCSSFFLFDLYRKYSISFSLYAKTKIIQMKFSEIKLWAKLQYVSILLKQTIVFSYA